MAIFITYARKDRAGVEALRQDLERSHNAVWMDNELTGGQSWWDAILGQIRACDLYVFALSPESLKSRACVSELDYALAVGRPLLPVLIRDVHLSLAPPAIANTQIADYRVRTVETGIALVAAVANRRAAPPQPDPLPPPPPPPMSYMNEFAELVDAPALSFQQQNHLLADLRGYLDHDEDDRVAAIELLRGLRRRRDIVESIGRQIDQLVPPQQPTAPPQSYGFAQPSPSSAQSPYGAMGYSGQPAGQPGQYNQPPTPRPMPTSQPTPGGYQPAQPYGSGPAMGPGAAIAPTDGDDHGACLPRRGHLRDHLDHLPGDGCQRDQGDRRQPRCLREPADDHHGAGDRDHQHCRRGLPLHSLLADPPQFLINGSAQRVSRSAAFGRVRNIGCSRLAPPSL